jgi:hypothetical protein
VAHEDEQDLVGNLTLGAPKVISLDILPDSNVFLLIKLSKTHHLLQKQLVRHYLFLA